MTTVMTEWMAVVLLMGWFLGFWAFVMMYGNREGRRRLGAF